MRDFSFVLYSPASSADYTALRFCIARRTDHFTFVVVIRFLRDENDSSSNLLKHLYDYRLVRPPEVPKNSTSRRHRCELADRILGILFSSPRESHWIRRIHGLSTEDYPGSGHTLRVRCVCVDLPRRNHQMELRGFIPVSGGSGDVCLLGKTVAVRGAVY